MTIDNPPSKASQPKDTEDPTYSIQIEPPAANQTVPDEISSPNKVKRANTKRRSLFINPFAKHSPKKETHEDTVHTNDVTTSRETTDSEGKSPTSPHGEKKITKGLGNLYNRLKVRQYYFNENGKY
jgi:hypothetical protein